MAPRLIPTRLPRLRRTVLAAVAGAALLAAPAVVEASGAQADASAVHVAHYRLWGNQPWTSGGNGSCSQASARGSYYPHGLWLTNSCTDDIAGAFYRVRLPAAASYGTVSVHVWGFTDRGNTALYRAFGLRGGGSKFVNGRTVTIPDTRHRVWYFGSTSAAGLVGSSHYLVLALSVSPGSDGSARDFDIGQVRIDVSYRS